MACFRNLLCRVLFYVFFVLPVISCQDDNRPKPIVFNAEESASIARIEGMIATGKSEEADQLIDSLYDLPEVVLNDHFRLKLLYLRTYMNYERHDNNETLKAIEETISYTERNPKEFREEYVRALFSKGDVFYRTGNYQAAYTNFYSARKMSEGYNDSCSLFSYDYRIANALYRQAKYDLAREYYRSSYRNKIHCDSFVSVTFRGQELLNNIGLCFYNTHGYDSALFYYDSALSYIRRMNFRNDQQRMSDIATGVVNGNIGKTYLAMGDQQKAELYLTRNVKVNLKARNEVRDGLTSLVALARLHYTQGRNEDLLNDIRLLYTWSDSIFDGAPFLEQAYRFHGFYFENRKQYDSAALYMHRYIVFHDSLTRAEKELSQNDVQFSLDGLDREYQYNLLKRDNQLKSNYVKFAILGAVLLLIIVIIILLSWLSSKAKNKALARLNEEIIKQKLMLEQRDQEKDRILSIVAHDLRTPIGAVQSIIDVLESGIMNSEEERLEMMNLIRMSCMSSLELINEILLISTLKENVSGTHKEKVNGNEFIRHTVDLIRFKAEEKSQTLALHLPATEFYLDINVEKLRRAVSNVITNAIKFSFIGGTVHVDARIEDMYLIISVKDDGIGIPDELKGRVFDSFTSAKRIGTAGEKPFGLGLSIVRQIVEAHHGVIWFESGAAPGTVFYIRLPLLHS